MSDLSDLYQEVILDHSRHPHNYHALPDATQKAEGFNPLCGDRVTLYLKVSGDVVEDISFEGNGCAISKSSASIMTDLLKGKTRTEVMAIFERFHQLVTQGNDGISEDDKLAVFSGVSAFPARVKCAVLAWHTLRSALEGKKDRVSTE